MNYAQFGLFIVYAFSVLSCGVGIYNIISKDNGSIMNRSVYLGETLLLGSILLVGQLLLLSLIRLYKAPYLWGIVIVNYAFILSGKTRDGIKALLPRKIYFNPPVILLIVFILILVFRNCFFLIDVDSQSVYLYTQRLWLSKGTSIFGDVGLDNMIFFPQFDTISYSLGISIFGHETLFPQFINIFWRLIVILLVFGYTSYRFTYYYGLAAAMFIILNDHLFYSGVNQWVLINGAVIALLFAVSYNFLESRRQNSSFRFVLALVFLSQLISNKYQMAYIAVFIFIFGVLIQPDPIKRIKEVLFNKRAISVLILAVFVMSLWHLKNFLVTGDPVFPAFAGRLKVFNWTIDQENTYVKVFGGVKPFKFFKYMNYLFIWPGINCAKIVVITISLLPLILIRAMTNSRKAEENLTLELYSWLGLSVLSVMGICLACHQDPRYYRFPIGILSFTAILSIHYVLKYCFNIRPKMILAFIILILPLYGGVNEGYKIIYDTGGPFLRPTFKENIDVIFNKIHTDYAINKHYPEVKMMLNVINENKEKLDESAWDKGSFNLAVQQFLLPMRPVVSMWYSTIIRWDSYSSEELIVEDLTNYGIKWIMQKRNKTLVFVPIEEYAKQAVKYERHPKKTYWDYGWPEELSDIEY